jgi:hexosaminidase
MEPGLTARDALSKADIRAILARAARDHVLVIPELDMPGHSAALLAHHAALELRPAAIYSSPAPAQYLTDKLDITNPATFALVRRLIEEYLPLFPGRYFDLGADEFISPAEYAIFPQLAAFAIATYGPGATPGDAIHGFINRVDALVRAHGKTLRVWNDQLGLGGVVPVAADVVVDWWIDVSPLGDTRTIDPGTLLGQGHAVLNGGWFPTYYATDLGPIEGRSNMRQAYEDWSVAQFCGPELTGDVRADPCSAVGPASRGLLGSQLNVWGPLPETPTQTEAGIWPRLAVIAQKTWDSPPSAASYAGFTALLGRLGSPR